MAVPCVAIIAFEGGMIAGTAQTKGEVDFADEDLATAKRVVSEFLHDRKAIQGQANDALLADAQELLKTIKELQDNRDKEASADAQSDSRDQP